MEWASPSGRHRAPQEALDRKLMHLLRPYIAFGAGFELNEIAWSRIESKVGSVMVLGIDLFVTTSSFGESHFIRLLAKAFQKELFKPVYSLLSYVTE